MKKFTWVIIAILASSSSVYSGIRGHSWGQTIEQTKEIETKRGSSVWLSSDENNILECRGKAGIVGVGMDFRFEQGGLVGISLYVAGGIENDGLLARAFNAKYSSENTNNFDGTFARQIFSNKINNSSNLSNILEVDKTKKEAKYKHHHDDYNGIPHTDIEFYSSTNIPEDSVIGYYDRRYRFYFIYSKDYFLGMQKRLRDFLGEVQEKINKTPDIVDEI